MVSTFAHLLPLLPELEALDDLLDITCFVKNRSELVTPKFGWCELWLSPPSFPVIFEI